MVSEKILRKRLSLGLTQEEFANKIGYSRSYVAEIETGKVQPSRKFLLAVSNKLNLSIDELVSDSLVLKAIDANRGTENPDIIFLFAFTQNDIEWIKDYLKELLKNRKTIIVEASAMTNYKQVYSAILNKEYKTFMYRDELSEILLNDEIMLVIKNISLSKMPKKQKGGVIRDIFKIMDDAWDSRKGDEDHVSRHKDPKSALIVLDFPSFLENFYNEIGYYAVPVYPLPEISYSHLVSKVLPGVSLIQKK